MARNRIIYASQSVWVNGEVLYRVQSLGTTTTFTSEDIFELGHLDIVDIVDDVPAVAVTLNTNDFGDVRTLAVLAQVPVAKIDMDATATNSNANLVVASGTDLVETSTYLHGVSLADFAIVCGNLPGVTLWAPVQDECSLGTLANNIDQTLFLDEVYINSLEFGYTTGANATENYGAETDNKMWLLNEGRFVSWDSFPHTGGETYFDLTLPDANLIPSLSSGNRGFLRKDANGAPAATLFDSSANEMVNIEITASGTVDTTKFMYEHIDDTGAHRLYVPTTGTYAAGNNDVIQVVYAANAYGTSATSDYFALMDSIERPDMLGALRQGQVEVFIVDPTTDQYNTSWDIAWRLTGCTITADLTREALAELGHLGPYDRPLTLPVPITATIDATAGDLEHWSRFADRYSEYAADTMVEIDLADLMASDDLKLVVKVFAQTDEEAGGTGGNRRIAVGSDLLAQDYWNDGAMGTYAAAGEQEYALKTIIVEHIKITDEAYTLDMGTNATQTFGFRSTNDLYAVKGDIGIGNLTSGNKVRRNA